MQSRYYDPELGRFINADSYASTGQGVLGNNMFAYCYNNPIGYVDENGDSAIWWALLQLCRMGFVHMCVEAHILSKYSTMGVEVELWLVNEKGTFVGRADVMIGGQVWEIKHGGNDPATQNARIGTAQLQAKLYLDKTAVRNGNTVTCLGPQNAFNGHFTVTVLDRSYYVEYTTPAEGAILYVITEIKRLKEADYELMATPYEEPANAKTMVIVQPSAVGIGICIGVGVALLTCLSDELSPMGRPCTAQ